MHGLMSYRRFERARSLRSDRAEHAFGRCVANLFELLSDDSRFLRKAFRKEESISKKYLSKKVSTFSSSGIWTLTSSQPFLTPTVSPPARWERGFLVRSQCADQTELDRADILWEASSVSGLEIHRRDLDFNGWIFCCLGFSEAGRHSSSAGQSWVFGKSNGEIFSS
ncbi:hypothetical protein F2Q69_00023346 [Brassica cretica]|uniref:Uncharacterized protein n=1 Tax=Brassica cretica TaxID=69181 RepID=A0A8S9Q235_BRACR|nr:hypothetical protein F2Q69_00023346 [Brassica cretica]